MTYWRDEYFLRIRNLPTDEFFSALPKVARFDLSGGGQFAEVVFSRHFWRQFFFRKTVREF